MSSASYPACWPGTQIIKSTHNAFNWRQSGDDAFCPLLNYPTDRAPLYNKWLADRIHSPRHTPDWPTYRDSHAAPARRGPKAKAKSGIGAHNGTIAGLSARADKLLQPRPALPGHMSTATQVTPMHLARATQPLAKQKAPANHSGAYSRATASAGAKASTKGGAA